MGETALDMDYKRIDFELLKVESINNIKFNNDIKNKVSSYQFKNMEIILRELFYNLDNEDKEINVEKLKEKTKLSENNIDKYLTKLIELDCLNVEVKTENKIKTRENGEKQIEK